MAFAEGKASLDDFMVMWEFFIMGEATEEDLDKQFADTLKHIEDLEFRNMLSGEEDRLGAIVNINSGAGGTESQDWAEMLMRMYLRSEEHTSELQSQR